MHKVSRPHLARTVGVGVLAVLAFALPLDRCWAQSPARPSVEATAAVGFSTFVDDDFIEHATASGSIRVLVAERWSVEPRFTYMRADATDDDFYLTASLVYDLETRGPVTPFLTIGGGFFWHRARFGRQTFVSRDWHLSGGGGARVRLAQRWSLTSEARFGIDPFFQVGGGLTYGF